MRFIQLLWLWWVHHDPGVSLSKRHSIQTLGGNKSEVRQENRNKSTKCTKCQMSKHGETLWRIWNFSWLCINYHVLKKYHDTKFFLDCVCFPAMSTPSPIPAPFPLSQPAWVLIPPCRQIPLQPAFWGCLPSHTSGLALLRPLHKSANRFKSLNGRSMETTYSDFWRLSLNFLFIISHTDSRAKRVISHDLNAVEPAAKNSLV